VARLGRFHLLGRVERLELSHASVLGSAFGNCHGRRQLARMRHREVDRPSADSFGPRLQPARKRHTRLRPADDLHLPPREGACDAEAKGLPIASLPANLAA
jgi:hypothetical protein